MSCMEYREVNRSHMYADASSVSAQCDSKKVKQILLEGQLGSLKDPDHGIYPMVTSSSTLAGIRRDRSRYTSIRDPAGCYGLQGVLQRGRSGSFRQRDLWRRGGRTETQGRRRRRVRRDNRPSKTCGMVRLCGVKVRMQNAGND